MALRFLAIISRAAHAGRGRPERRFETLGLALVTDDDDFELWSSDASKVIVSPAGRTQILGRLYTRGDQPQRVLSLGQELDRATDVAAMLCSRYWGHYVAFSRSVVGSIQIFRDPSGGLPCYVKETPDEIFLFSDIDLAADIGLTTREIDWDEIRTLLAWPGLRPTRTALREIGEIPQGWLLAIGGRHYAALRQLWSPWDFVASEKHGQEEIAAALRATVTGVVHALAREFERTQLCLSGGLDSSIVAAGLAESAPICLNLVADGCEGDERAEALIVTEHLGLELIDRKYRFDHVDLSASSAAHLPRPVGNPGRMAFDRANLEIAEARNTRALFTGFGGDNVFCLMQSATPIADRLRATHSPFGAWRTMLDVCQLTGCSISTALGRASRKLPRNATRYRWARESRFLKPDAFDDLPDQPTHSWLETPGSALPGRAAHIAMLMRTQNFAEGFSRCDALEMINPLLSQPLVEFCLSIPSWKWVVGGRDRAPARAAFVGLLPDATINRRAKGGPGAFYRKIIERHGCEIRQRLFDGELARQGLLDLPAIEGFFNSPIDAKGLPYNRLLDLTDAEAWIAKQRSA